MKEIPAVSVPTIQIRSTINYHYAHVMGYIGEPSIIDLTNSDQGIVKINNAATNVNSISVKFAPDGIKAIIDNEPHNLSLDIDDYSGTVAIRYSIPRSIRNPNIINIQYIQVDDDPYIYKENVGYSERVKIFTYKGRSDLGIAPQFEWENKYKPASDFGYILESPPRIMKLLLKEFVFVENLQQGILKCRTSTFDLKGYVVQLFPKAILEFTQIADQIKMGLLETDSHLKEVSESKIKEAPEKKVSEGEAKASLEAPTTAIHLESISANVSLVASSAVATIDEPAVELTGDNNASQE